MSEDYPTPPPELVAQWMDEINGGPGSSGAMFLAKRAVAWGYRQAREDARRVAARASMRDELV